MVKQLRLFGNVGKFIEDNEYIKVDNDALMIKVVTSFGANTILFAKLNNGVEEKSIRIFGNKFEIENNYLNAGECLLKIVAMVGNNIVGQYSCTPILVKEIDNNKLVLDKLQDFDLKIQGIKKSVEDFEKSVDGKLSKIENALKELIIVE